ncbi:MAG TPA: DUF4157 domain-containing protein [Pyrinomonadaceae bacterium]
MKDHETKKDGAHGHPPPKAKTGSERDAARKQTDGQTAARPDLLSDERLAHPANAEPLAELLSQLQHTHGNAYVQRVVAEKSREAKPGESHTQPGAQSLDAGTRSLMESAFGESFGDVRVHTGPDAGRVNEELGARAVTRGQDIYFAEGEYNPSTAEGRRLLAHELTHVVQQRGASGHGQDLSVGPAGDAFEIEADEVAASVVAGQRPQVISRAPTHALQRQGRQAQPPAESASQMPVIRRFPDPIRPGPQEVMLNVDGWFTIYYLLNDVRGEEFVTLKLRVPAGMTVGRALINSEVDAAHYRETNVRGSGARTVSIGISRKVAKTPLLQVEFTMGNRIYVVVFQFPIGSPPEKPQPPRQGGGR